MRSSRKFVVEMDSTRNWQSYAVKCKKSCARRSSAQHLKFPPTLYRLPNPRISEVSKECVPNVWEVVIKKMFHTLPTQPSSTLGMFF
eukprot:1956562-Amphidinium_carterae.1